VSGRLTNMLLHTYTTYILYSYCRLVFFYVNLLLESLTHWFVVKVFTIYCTLLYSSVLLYFIVVIYLSTFFQMSLILLFKLCVALPV